MRFPNNPLFVIWRMVLRLKPSSPKALWERLYYSNGLTLEDNLCFNDQKRGNLQTTSYNFTIMMSAVKVQILKLQSSVQYPRTFKFLSAYNIQTCTRLIFKHFCITPMYHKQNRKRLISLADGDILFALTTCACFLV